MYDNISAETLEIGNGVHISPSASIRGLNGKSKRISIGDHTYIGENVQIICDDFQIGDYSKIHHHTNVHGYKKCEIGHNAWIGQYCIIDCIGGMRIGNNCGIGAHSQLWSHIKFGDTLNGCRFNSNKKMNIGNDVWFVGHCIVSPVTAKDKSMAMVGSVITGDMDYNTIYAGVPAKEISSKIGPQFDEVSTSNKLVAMNKYLLESKIDQKSIMIVDSEAQISDNLDISYFDVTTGKYSKRGTKDEIAFMKFLLPEKAKFVPF